MLFVYILSCKVICKNVMCFVFIVYRVLYVCVYNSLFVFRVRIMRVNTVFHVYNVTIFFFFFGGHNVRLTHTHEMQ